MQYVIAVLVLLALGWAIYLFLSRRERDDDSSDATVAGAESDPHGGAGLMERRLNPGTVFDGPATPAVRTASASQGGSAEPIPAELASVPTGPSERPVAAIPAVVPAELDPTADDVPSSWTWAADERESTPSVPASVVDPGPDPASAAEAAEPLAAERPGVVPAFGERSPFDTGREAEVAARTEALAAELPVTQDAAPDVSVLGDHAGEAAAEAVVLGLGVSGDAGVEAAQEESTVADAASQVPAFDPSSVVGEVDPTEQVPVDVGVQAPVDVAVVGEVETDEDAAEPAESSGSAETSGPAAGDVAAAGLPPAEDVPVAVDAGREAEVAARTEALAAELPVTQDAAPDVSVLGEHAGEAAAEGLVLGLGASGDAGVEAAQEESTVADAASQVPAFDPSTVVGEVDPTEQVPVEPSHDWGVSQAVSVVATPEPLEVSATTEDVTDAESSVAEDLVDESHVVGGAVAASDDVADAAVVDVVADSQGDVADIAAEDDSHDAPTFLEDPARPASSTWEQTHGIDTTVFAPPAGAFGDPEPTPEPTELPLEVEPDVVSDGDTASEMVSEGDPNFWHGRHEAGSAAPESAAPTEAEAIEIEPDVVSDGDTPSEMVAEGDPNFGHGIPSASVPEAQPDTVAGGAWVRRISSVAEIRDGGYGVGSAAPFDDLAMPYGHPVKAWNDTRTFRDPDSPFYDEAEPHVWFSDDGAAQRAGFRPAD